MSALCLACCVNRGGGAVVVASNDGGAKQVRAKVKVETGIQDSNLISIANPSVEAVTYTATRPLNEGKDMFSSRPSFRLPAVPPFLRGCDWLAGSVFFINTIDCACPAEVFGDGCAGVGRGGEEFRVAVVWR